MGTIFQQQIIIVLMVKSFYRFAKLEIFKFDWQIVVVLLFKDSNLFVFIFDIHGYFLRL